ncbi:MAG: aminodeoxychorismate/anthranilate synthase component II [Bacteroidales bacterium]|nr:aminodeoxychorismate/anthranilate synthase component II [Bacteroidales bacterium]
MCAKVPKRPDRDPVLIIDHFDSFTYNLVKRVEEAGGRCDVVSCDRLTPVTTESYHKIILSPGPGIPEDFPLTMQLIREQAPEKSILGICLGHEAIAMAYGAEIYHLGRVFHGIRRQCHIEAGYYVLTGLPDPFTAGCYHSWAVLPESLPGELQITARTEDGIIMALAHREYDLTGLMFHPESYMTPQGLQIMKNWLQHVENVPGLQ